MASEQPQMMSSLPKIGSARIVGLISDTHIPTRARSIPTEVFKAFENVEFIVHAGDLVDISVVDELEQVAPVLAVCGNMDGPEVRGKLPKTNSMKVAGWHIGVMHDPKTHFGIGKMRDIVKQNDFDVLVYGHTHSSSVKWEGKTLFINPGSPTNPNPPFIVKPSVALLKITKEQITPEIIQL